jgi:hypothetical protein
VRFELGGHKNSDDLQDSTMMNLARGDVLIFDGQMLHRGVYKHNPIRKAFDVCGKVPSYLFVLFRLLGTAYRKGDGAHQ